jgi:Flp pilus assembly protein TadG
MHSQPKIARNGRGLLTIVARFLRNRRGAVSPIMALALIPIVGAMGMGVETSNWWLTQRSAQNAADSAVLAAAINGGNADSGGTPAAAASSCTSGANAANWACEAYAAAAKMGYTVSTTASVTPSTTTCPSGTGTCYKVVIRKAVPIYLLTVLGYNGTTVGSNKVQWIQATAYSKQPGPPIQFCILTTNGDFTSKGASSADLLGCDVFSNGNATCDGATDGIGQTFATGTISKCPVPTTTSAKCDPYGPKTQVIEGTSTSCSASTDASASIPPMPSCTSPNSKAATSGSFPAADVITTAAITAAVTANPTTPVIQICGNASLGTGSGASAKPGNCTTPINYTGSANIKIIVYNGSLDIRGCTIENTGTGGMTLMFAPPSAVATAPSNCSGSNGCVPIDTNSSPGTIDIAAPTSGTFSGLAVMQSSYYTEASGDCSGSGNKAGALDWCGAGHAPTIEAQGALYLPNANLGFAGAISKFTGPGALNCIGLVSKSVRVNGTGELFNNFASGLTGQCTAAGLSLPTDPNSKTYQALVG